MTLFRSQTLGQQSATAAMDSNLGIHGIGLGAYGTRGVAAIINDVEAGASADEMQPQFDLPLLLLKESVHFDPLCLLVEVFVSFDSFYQPEVSLDSLRYIHEGPGDNSLVVEPEFE